MTQKSRNYILTELNNEYYILPYGQAVEDFQPGCAVSEETALLWNLLDETDDIPLLTRKFCEAFSLEDYDPKEMESMISEAILDLKRQGFLNDGFRITIMDPPAFCVSIAGVNIQLCGNKDLFHNSLRAFQTEKKEFDLSFAVTYRSTLPRENGTVVLRNDEMALMETAAEYIVFYLSTNELKEAHISKDMKKTIVYCSASVTDEGKEILLNTLRYVFLTYISKQNLYALHSVSILHNGKAWLFSGPSGTGKTTHTNLWKKLYQTEILNGDLNLIGYENNKPTIFGVPWCGSSEKYTTENYPLGGIVLLKQSPVNSSEHLTKNDQVILVSQRLINTHTNSDQLINTLQFLNQLTKDIHVFRLYCNMENNAAETCRKEIDSFGESTE